ncbi:protein of unknown function [Enterobacter cancerogenus]|nr:protein of unknown function [Enterobacter cancerogenus]
MRQCSCRLPVVQALPGIAGIKPGKLLALLDGRALANVQGFYLSRAFEGEVGCVTGFNPCRENALAGSACCFHLGNFHHAGQRRIFLRLAVAGRERENHPRQ